MNSIGSSGALDDFEDQDSEISMDGKGAELASSCLHH